MQLKISKQDSYLLTIFILLSIGIIVKSIMDPNGYLSSDSTEYLSLAKNLLDGNGPYYYDTMRIHGHTFFATWPLGYPFLIYLVAKCTGLTVFLASKVLNIICIAISLAIFKVLFDKSAYIYSFIFSTATVLLTFSSTWSEAPFIFAFLWLAASILLFAKSSSMIYLFSLFFSCATLFLFRYIGALGFIFSGLFSLYYLFQKKYITSIKILLVTFFVCVFMISYLYMNYEKTGYITGISRLPAADTHYELIASFLKAFIIEFNLIRTPGGTSIYNIPKFIFWLLFQSVLFIYLFKDTHIMKKSNKNEDSILAWKIFFIVGCLYFLGLIILRWNKSFAEFYSRLMAPGFFMFLTSFISFFQFRSTEEAFYKLKIFIITIGIISYILNVPGITVKNYLKNGGITYFSNIKEIEQLYSKIPGNSIILFGDRFHLPYLRTSLIPIAPSLIATEHDTISSIFSKVRKLYPGKDLYLQVKNYKDSDLYHRSISEFVYKNRNNDFVKIQ